MTQVGGGASRPLPGPTRPLGEGRELVARNGAESEKGREAESAPPRGRVGPWRGRVGPSGRLGPEGAESARQGLILPERVESFQMMLSKYLPDKVVNSCDHKLHHTLSCVLGYPLCGSSLWGFANGLPNVIYVSPQRSFVHC